MDALNIIRPNVICKATDNISEQIEIVKKLIDKGFAYDTPEAVYFEVSKFPNYGDAFGQRLNEKKVAVRDEVKTGEHKRNPFDFALWFKRIGRFENHTMHWDSPWGDGFPGWHIECSAMSIKYLGDQFDIHTGGEDHISIHHPNEIAQSEAATGKSPFVNYWLHTAFLMVDGTKMSKSLGNFYTIQDVKDKGINPLALRYLYLTAHYRDPMNFTWESLQASQNAIVKLWKSVNELKKEAEKRPTLSSDKMEKLETYHIRFNEAVNDDLNTAVAISIIWEVVKSNIPSMDKLDFLNFTNEVLGLWTEATLLDVSKQKVITDEVAVLIKKREDLRKEKKFEEADQIRKQIEELGFDISDLPLSK